MAGATPVRPSSPTPFGLDPRDGRIDFVDEQSIEVWHVGVDGHLVAGQVVVDEEPEPLVDHHLLHQRGANSHGDAADHLTARRLRVEDAASRTHRKDAANANHTSM